jgi:hypothetical protein
LEKRGLILGDYDTAVRGWTLTKWELSPAKRKENLVDKPGGHGHWDLSTVLTDGEPVYEARTLTATLECSEGDRFSREAEIDTMINWLDGWTVKIILPDKPLQYISGVVHVKRLYNDMAHASVAVEATVDPWRYNAAETVVNLVATTNAQTADLVNPGRLPVVPLLEVVGAQVNLTFGTLSWTLDVGSYKLPDFRLTQGTHKLTYSGRSGQVRITFREGVL